MEPSLGDTKICKEFAFLPRMVYLGACGEDTQIIWFREYFSVYEYVECDDWLSVIPSLQNRWVHKREFILW